MEIGSLMVESGQRKAGWLEVARMAGGSTIALPVAVVVGEHAGPTLGLVAGVHGDEYEGIRVIWDLYRELDVSRMHGSIVGVPIASPPAYQAANRASPLDGVNLNRAFPGRSRGTVSERIAATLVERVVARSDLLLDLHSGGAIMEILPLIFASRADLAKKGVPDLIRATGLPLVWFAPPFSGPLAQAALARDIPATTLEVGGIGRLDMGAVGIMKDAILNTLRYAGILTGSAPPLKAQTEVDGNFIVADVGGFFQASVSLGQCLQEEEPYGVILDSLGEQIVQLVAPHAGLVCAVRTSPPVQVGDQLVLIGRTA